VAYLEQPEQGARGEEAAAASQGALGDGDDGPEHDLNGDPAVGADLLGHELRGELGAQEGQAEDGVAVVVVWWS